jgi:hypothetical protein
MTGELLSVPDTLELELDERAIPMEVRRRTSVASQHTGAQLEEMHGWVKTDSEDVHRWLSVTLRRLGDGMVRTFDEARDTTDRWQLSWNSYGETDGVHSYGLILREAEDLTLDVLLLDSLELRPYEYREQIIDGSLTIWAKMVGSHTDVTRINRLIRTRATFPVVRRGIQDTPREMRLGVAEWSEYEDRIKYRLVLIDGDIDESVRSEMGEIQQQNDRSAFGYYANMVDRMAELFVEKGLLSRKDLESLRDAARAQPGVARHEVWHVSDVDQL